LAYRNVSIDPNNYEVPIKKEWLLKAYKYSLSTNNLRWLRICEVRMNTDKGWFAKSTESVSNYSLAEDSLDIFSGTGLTISVTNQGTVINYDRSYTKIQDVLGNVFGFSGSIVFLLSLIVSPYFDLKLFEKLGNLIFEIDWEGYDSKLKKKNRFRRNSALKFGFLKQRHGVTETSRAELPQKSGNPNNSNESINHSMEKSLDKLNIEKLELNKPSEDSSHNVKDLKKYRPPKSKQKEIRLTYFKWFIGLFRPVHEYILLNQIKSEYQKKVDCAVIFKAIIEIENLKLLLLNQDQRVLFDSFSCIKISAESKSINDAKQEILDTTKDQENRALMNIQEKEHMSEIDKILISRFLQRKEMFSY
jgi:hypothetical protein